MSHLSYHTSGAEPSTFALIDVFHRRVQTPQMKGVGTAVTINEGPIRSARRTMVVVVGLLRRHVSGAKWLASQ